jgi:hypothetical protein
MTLAKPSKTTPSDAGSGMGFMVTSSTAKSPAVLVIVTCVKIGPEVVHAVRSYKCTDHG